MYDKGEKTYIYYHVGKDYVLFLVQATMPSPEKKKKISTPRGNIERGESCIEHRGNALNCFLANQENKVFIQIKLKITFF